MNWILVLAAALSSAASTPAETRPAPSASIPPSLAQQRAAIARQRASVRQQSANLSVWMLPGTDAPPSPVAGDPGAPACEPMADSIVAPLIESAAKTNSLEPRLIRAVIEQESAFRPCAISAKGAQGLMQLMPDTARDLQVPDPFDPAQNIQAGARYLKELLDKFKGDLPQALAAYNAGPASIDQAGAIPDIPETRAYVDAILQKLGLK